MSKSYLLTLQPMEPYFFGNEKTFSFDPQKPGDNRYFIKGERLPLQTTLLGVLRYLLMPVKNAGYRYTESDQSRNAAVIGPESFQINADAQQFGAIRSISPVFLTCGGQKYVRTPFDHTVQETARYTPFRDYQAVETDRGVRWFAADYDAKAGLSDSYMNTADGSLIPAETLFSPVVRVGISKGKQEKAFFKKQFLRLADGWAFSAYITLDTDVLAQDPGAQAALAALESGTSAYLGQNKSAFALRLQPEENTLPEQVSRHLRPGVVYCLGDALVPGAVYDGCLFAAVRLRDYRAYQTVFRKQADETGTYVGGISKSQELHKLLCAGSILIPHTPDSVQNSFHHPNCQTIGFNITVSKTEDSEK